MLAYHEFTADYAETSREAATMASPPRETCMAALGIMERESGHAGLSSRFHIGIAARTMQSATLDSGCLCFLHIINAAATYFLIVTDHST